MLTLRPFHPDDAPALDGILQAVWPDDPHSREVFQDYGPAAIKPGQTLHLTLVTALDRHLVGFGSIYESKLHPKPYYLHVQVHPEFQGQGIGQQLYGQLIEILRGRTPKPLQVSTMATQERALRFLRDRGYVEYVRTYLPLLDVSAVDLNAFADVEADVQAEGYVIRSMAELASDPDRDNKLADLHTAVYEQTHAHNRPAAKVLQQERSFFLSDAIPEALFVALKDGEYVALSSVRAGLLPGQLETAWAGAVGTAFADCPLLLLAMRLREIAYARQHGITHLRGEFDSVDECLLTAMDELPWQETPDWVTYVRPGPGGILPNR